MACLILRYYPPSFGKFFVQIAVSHAQDSLPGPRDLIGDKPLKAADAQLSDFEIFNKYFGTVESWDDLWIDAWTLVLHLIFPPPETSTFAQAGMPAVVRYLAGSRDMKPPGQWVWASMPPVCSLLTFQTSVARHVICAVQTMIRRCSLAGWLACCLVFGHDVCIGCCTMDGIVRKSHEAV